MTFKIKTLKVGLIRNCFCCPTLPLTAARRLKARSASLAHSVYTDVESAKQH